MVSLLDMKALLTQKTFKLVSAVCWFILPFLIWAGIYLLVGQKLFFLPGLSILGIFFLTVFIVVSLWTILSVGNLREKVRRRIESAKRFFDHPNNTTYEEEFKIEASANLISYVYLPKLTSLGASRIGKFSILSAVLQFFVSYSIMGFLFNNRDILLSISSHISSLFPPLYNFGSFLGQNLIIVIVVLALISLYFNPNISVFRKKYIELSRFDLTINVLGDAFSVVGRFSFLVMCVASVPFILKQRKHVLKYEPFLFPRDLASIAQHSFNEVEKKICKTLEWSLKVEEEEHVKIVEAISLQEKDTGPILKTFIELVDFKKAFESLKSVEPTVFLGIVENRCALLGVIRYDATRKIWVAELSFDSAFVKEYFKSVAEKTIEDGKRIIVEEKLPQVLKVGMSNMKQSQMGGIRDETRD